MEKIGLQDYLLKKQTRELEKPVYRNLCTVCLHPEFSCYCPTIQTFDPKVQFVILIHPIEFQRRIATGRMAHLILQNSTFVRGHDFSQDPIVNSILSDPQNHCVVLYPGNSSLNISEMRTNQKNIFPADKKLVVFVIDGTWATARQMMRLSQNLRQVPQVCFTPKSKSNFRVRKQPDANCLSTIEAIHEFIEVAGPYFNFDKSTRHHDILLKAFDSMVEKQIECAKKYA
jgi:DTW domain-containing protein